MEERKARDRAHAQLESLKRELQRERRSRAKLTALLSARQYPGPTQRPVRTNSLEVTVDGIVTSQQSIKATRKSDEETEEFHADDVKTMTFAWNTAKQ